MFIYEEVNNSCLNDIVMVIGCLGGLWFILCMLGRLGVKVYLNIKGFIKRKKKDKKV